MVATEIFASPTVCIFATLSWEASMKGHLSTLVTISILIVLAVLTPTAYAAKSPAMDSCTAEWKTMKAAGTIRSGQTWPQFWSQCVKDYAAAHPTQSTSDQNVQAPAPMVKKAASSRGATIDESDAHGSGEQKKQCDGKWASYKSSSGAHGWHDYFQFMAKCM